MKKRTAPAEEKPRAVRSAYVEQGVESYYRAEGAEYRNPHEPALRELLALCWEAWPLPNREILDLACGSGEATLALEALGAEEIHGADPFTGAAYRERTGRTAQAWSFEQLAAGIARGRRYRLIVCSFALHLARRSELPALAIELAQLAPHLLILTPHKRPHIDPSWGWNLRGEIAHRRVRARWYSREAG